MKRSFTMATLNVPAELAGHIQEEAKKSNYQLVGIGTRGGNTFLVEIVLDKEGGITLDECGEFNRRISSWIDGQNLFKSGYNLDVCSPGLDRELKSDSDFSWAIGKDVKVTTHEAIEGENMIIGKLLEANEGEDITIEKPKDDKVRISRGNVAKARLWPKV